ncbi:hypothetical protein [Delftia acidovorans]|uniref:DUF7948 domain-containing protein n=1 Tax=Delftia acidovorans TaxID=80866 RepID=UPI0018E0A37B|nr:hypothetical protein [Delftia acidovorans]
MAASTAHAAPGERPGAAQLQHAKQALQGLSMPFEANSGQFDPAVAFMGRTFAGAVHVTHQGQIVYGLPGPDTGRLADWARSKAAGGAPKSAPILRPGWSLTETLVGALPLSPSGGEAAGTQITRFSGPHRYQPATYRNLHLGQAWTGVQVELAVRGTNVEKLFHVAPQADPGQIQVRVDGALSLRLGEGGELVAATGHGDVAYTAPVAFQEVAGQRVEVPVQYALNSQGDGYGFALGAYDRALPLVIDPLLQSIYLGSPESSWIEAIATAAPSGDVLLAGTTLSNRFPGTAGGAQPASPPGIFALHGFVARLSSDLSRLIQSTYLSGSWGSQIHALAVTASGDVVVSGETMTSDFPGTAGGAQPVSLSVPAGFVARLSGDLRTLEQSTYLTGDGWVVATALALPASGEVVVAGDTLAKDLPRAANGAQPALSADRDGFVMRLSADLRTVVQSTYLGGTGAESISNIAIGPSGEILAGGQTQSPDLPATAHAAQPDISGDADGFIALLSGDLRTLVRSSYLGGTAGRHSRHWPSTPRERSWQPGKHRPLPFLARAVVRSLPAMATTPATSQGCPPICAPCCRAPIWAAQTQTGSLPWPSLLRARSWWPATPHPTIFPAWRAPLSLSTVVDFKPATWHACRTICAPWSKAPTWAQAAWMVSPRCTSLLLASFWPGATPEHSSRTLMPLSHS